MLFLFLFRFADAYETSKMLCEQYYLTSPDMEITQVNCKSCGTTTVFLFAEIFNQFVLIFEVTPAYTALFLFHLGIFFYSRHQFEPCNVARIGQKKAIHAYWSYV